MMTIGSIIKKDHAEIKGLLISEDTGMSWTMVNYFYKSEKLTL